MLCPITLQPFVDPVLAEDGHTYERHAIEKWFISKHSSPVTNQHIGTRLTPNHLARSITASTTPETTLESALGKALLRGNTQDLSDCLDIIDPVMTSDPKRIRHTLVSTGHIINPVLDDRLTLFEHSALEKHRITHQRLAHVTTEQRTIADLLPVAEQRRKELLEQQTIHWAAYTATTRHLDVFDRHILRLKTINKNNQTELADLTQLTKHAPKDLPLSPVEHDFRQIAIDTFYGLNNRAIDKTLAHVLARATQGDPEITEWAQNTTPFDDFFTHDAPEHFYDHDDPTVSQLTTAATNGSATARFRLGLAHKNGHNVDKDYDAAVQLLHQASNQNLSEAKMHLAQLTHDPDTRLSLLRQAATMDGSVVEAMYNTSRELLSRENVSTQNLASAINYAWHAAIRGHTAADDFFTHTENIIASLSRVNKPPRDEDSSDESSDLEVLYSDSD